MNNPSWFLGIDLGTGSCKCIAVDEQGQILGSGSSAYEGGDTRQRWREQDPRQLQQAAIAAVRQTLARAPRAAPERCAGMSIGGALHSVMALDRQDRPLTGVITWADGRAAGQARAVARTETGRDLYRETGCPVHGMYPLYKIIWLREQRPELFERARRFVSAKEYLGHAFTGAWRIDYSLAAGSGFLGTDSLQWSDTALGLAGIRREQLSALADPDSLLGRLRPELAARMGIAPHTPVALGSSDAVNSSLGAGAVSPTQATLMIGTSGALRVICPRPVLDPGGRSWCYAIDRRHWLVGGAIHNGGVALSWLCQCLNHAHAGAALNASDLLALAARAPAGSGGVICLPFFAGERSPKWNLDARAAFCGLGLEHDLHHLTRALLEGIGFRFQSLLDVLLEIGLEVTQILASGGFTQSRFWLQLMSDILGREVRVPVPGETSALAAAFWAALATGCVSRLEQIRQWVGHGHACRPAPRNRAIYQRLYLMYTRLYQSLGGCFEELARLQREMATNEEDPGDGA
jgi:gluconokinase